MNNKNIPKKERRKNEILSAIDSFLLENFKLALFLLIVLILLLGYFFILNPKYNKIKKNVAVSNEEMTNIFENLNYYLKGLNLYIDQYKKINPELTEKISKVLPVGSKKEEMYILINQIAQNENVFLMSIDIMDKESTNKNKKDDQSTSKVPSELGVITVEAGFMGVSYQQLNNLLGALEKSLRIIDVRSVIFDPGNQSLSLKLDTYYLKEN